MDRTDLQTKLDALSASFAELIAPPVTLVEIVDLAKKLGDVVLEYNPAGSYAEHLADLKIAWDWAEAKFDLIRKLDDAVALPFVFEAFDGPFFRWVVPNAVLPSVARLLEKKQG